METSLILTEAQEELFSQLVKELNVNQKILDSVYDEIDCYDNPDNFIVMNFTHYGEPKGQPRARMSTKLNIMFDGSKSLRQTILEQVMAKMPKNFKPTSNYIECDITFYLNTPKGFSKRDTLLAELGIVKPTKKPDIDNLQKLIFDSLNKVLYADDSSVVTCNARKLYSCKPRTEISLRIKK